MIVLADSDGPDQTARMAGRSGPLLSAYAQIHVFLWRGRDTVDTFDVKQINF